MKTLWSIEILCIFVCVQYYRNVVVQSGDILISGIQLWPALLMCSPQSLMLFLWAKRNFYCIIICFPLNYSQLGTCILHCVRSLWDRGLLGSWRSTRMEEVEHLLLATFYELYKKTFNAYNSLLKWGERNPKRDSEGRWNEMLMFWVVCHCSPSQTRPCKPFMALSSLHASLLTREPPTGNNLKKTQY